MSNLQGSAMEGVGSMTSIDETLIVAAMPALGICILVAAVTIAAVVRSGVEPSSAIYQNNKLWKTKHIFQVREEARLVHNSKEFC